jgi:hypothetical protein
MNEYPHQKKKKGERERNTLFLKIEESREGDWLGKKDVPHG